MLDEGVGAKLYALAARWYAQAESLRQRAHGSEESKPSTESARRMVLHAQAEVLMNCARELRASLRMAADALRRGPGSALSGGAPAEPPASWGEV